MSRVQVLGTENMLLGDEELQKLVVLRFNYKFIMEYRVKYRQWVRPLADPPGI